MSGPDNINLLLLGLEDLKEDLELFTKNEDIMRVMSYIDGVEEKYGEPKIKQSEVNGLSNNPEKTIVELVSKNYFVKQEIDGEHYLLRTDSGKRVFDTIMGLCVTSIEKVETDESFKFKLGDNIYKVKRFLDAYIHYRELGKNR